VIADDEARSTNVEWLFACMACWKRFLG
jgi:hypothetical protein